MKKVLFFIADTVPTTSETNALNAILASTEQTSVLVRSAKWDAQYGTNLEQADFVAGASVPTAYSGLPVWSASANLPATQTIVSNAAAVVVKNSAGTTVTGTHVAEVAANALTDVKLAATVAPVVNAANVAVQNSAGTAVAGNHPATVTAGVATVKLASTVAPVVSGVDITVPVTGTYVNKITPTVVNGVLTAIVLG